MQLEQLTIQAFDALGDKDKCVPLVTVVAYVIGLGSPPAKDRFALGLAVKLNSAETTVSAAQTSGTGSSNPDTADDDLRRVELGFNVPLPVDHGVAALLLAGGNTIAADLSSLKSSLLFTTRQLAAAITDRACGDAFQSHDSSDPTCGSSASKVALPTSRIGHQ